MIGARRTELSTNEVLEAHPAKIFQLGMKPTWLDFWAGSPRCRSFARCAVLPRNPKAARKSADEGPCFPSPSPGHDNLPGAFVLTIFHTTRVADNVSIGNEETSAPGVKIFEKPRGQPYIHSLVSVSSRPA